MRSSSLRFSAFALFSIVAGAAACTDAVPEWTEAEGYRSRPLIVRGQDAPGFTSLPSARTGIAFANDPTIEMTSLNQHLANGAGVAIGDVDGDGRPDVFFPNTRGENRLFRNLGDFSFEDVSEGAGLDLPDRHPTGATFADTDGDGDLDLLVSAMGGAITLFENDGTGGFTDRSAERGFQTRRAGSTMSLADIDGDGDLDIYAANYRFDRAADAFSPEDRRSTPVLEQRDGGWVVNEMYREYYRVREGPQGVMSWEFGEADDLYLNDGTGTFIREAVLGPRFLDASGAPLTEEPQDWGLSARFHDVDGDGDPDLYVANDFESPDYLWINDGSGTFREVGAPALRKTSSASMSVAFSDVDGDGSTDIFVADMLPISTRYRKTQVSTLREGMLPPGSIDGTVQVNRNTLLLGRPDGSYREAAQQVGLAASGWTWASEFLDVDLDGHDDLLVANGHLWDPLDADTGDRLRNTQATAGADWHEVINLFPSLELQNRAFRNRGDGTFELVADGWGLDAGPDISHGMATGDLDGDGDLDLIVNRLGSPALVLRNEAAAPRVAVRLSGRPPNTEAVGASLSVSGGVAPPGRQAEAGGVYLSDSEGLHTFAAGDAERLTLEVRWPSGVVSRLADVSPNHLYELEEPSGSPEARPSPVVPTPLFEDATADLRHSHVDRASATMGFQPLLPRDLTRLGPGVTWTDIDADGDPDLVVGGGAGGRIAVIENRSGPWVARTGSATLEYDVTTLLPLPAGSGTRVLAGQANFEAASVADARALSPVRSFGLGPSGLGASRGELDLGGSSVGAMTSADVDGDGDLDVFVAGRALATAYPLPPQSRLFLTDDNGSLVWDSIASAAFVNAGLVSGATFTDIDGDADPDLVLATDWGPPRVFANQGGRFFDRTAELGLTELTSWWNGVTAGDLNGDGRMDLVLTSWGRNHDLEASPDRPLLGFWADFDRNGTLDMLLARTDPRVGAPALLTSLVRLSQGLPFVRRQTTPTFAAYADATAAEVLGASFEATRREAVTTFDHVVALQRDDGFEVVPLPFDAQLAPAFHASVVDFDGDGSEDVFLSQNAFPNRRGTERRDAGLGLLLLGDGSGGLRAVRADESGIRLYGDQRGAAVADFDGDGRVDLAVGQNSGPTALLHNRGASPGLRVRVVGGRSNPNGVGSWLRLVYPDGPGPVREIRNGSGYWSVDDPVVVLGGLDGATALRVRAPDGVTRDIPLPEDTRETLVVRLGS